MKSLRLFPLSVLVLLTVVNSLRAQVTTILHENEDGWYNYHPTSGINPSASDVDFHSTWYRRSLENYTGTRPYNGPVFRRGEAPFSYGIVSGITPGTKLPLPAEGRRHASYFLKVVDGGSYGFHSLDLSLLADDGAYVYLNGVLIARDNVTGTNSFTKTADEYAHESTYDPLTLISTPKLRPGPNLLAVSVHNIDPSSTDLGFALRLQGIPGSHPKPQVLISSNSGNWGYLQHLDGEGRGIDPSNSDSDFDTTWFRQSFRSYQGGSYNGPFFSTGGTAPFVYGRLRGVNPGTTLPKPESGTRHSSYFLHQFDGGTTGYGNLDLTLLAAPGAFVYLNGQLIATRGIAPGLTDSWDTLGTVTGNDSNFTPVTFLGSTKPVVKPGPNLLAISVHQSTTIGSDLGFKLRLTGTPGLPDIGAVYANNLSPTTSELTWRTKTSGDSVVSYGRSPEDLSKTVRSSLWKTDHWVRLSGLLPDTTYYFEVRTHRGNSVVSETGSFRSGKDPAAVSLTRQPYLQSVSHDRVTLCWRTSRSGNSVVRYGRLPWILDRQVTLPGARTNHAVTIKSLPPGQRWYYQVETRNSSGREGRSDGSFEHYFETSPAPGSSSPTRIWVIGDSGTANDDVRDVYNAFRAYNGSSHTDLMLMLGDNAYGDGTSDQYQVAVFDRFSELLRNTPMWSTLGNHDVRSLGGAPYFQQFVFPRNGECGGVASGTEAYYSFDRGNIHFICLDSQTSGNYDDTLGGSGMMDWLQADLEATTADWIIAYFHHGPYTKGSHDSDVEDHHIIMRNNAVSLLERYGVDLILSGHSHAYERSRLINRHYGASSTYHPQLHAVDAGNGSEVGRIGTDGRFVADGGDGAYVKPLARGNAGQVSTIVGSSGKLSHWSDGSSFVVNENPHPVHTTNLRLLGSLVIDIEANRLHAVFLDRLGSVRDDFSIVKGSALAVQVPDSSMTEDTKNHRSRIEVVRTGKIDEALEVDYVVGGTASSDDYYPELSGRLSFAPGEASKRLALKMHSDNLAEGPETLSLTLKSRGAPVQPGASLRNVYVILPENEGRLTLHDRPAQDWWFRNYGGATLADSDWMRDDDQDCMGNLLEYALNADPSVYDTTAVPVPTKADGRLELRYLRDNTKDDLRYRVLTSTDLVNWTPVGVTDELEGTENPHGLEQRRASVPLDGLQRFLTLEVSLR